MKISDTGLALIKHCEGLRLTRYNDTGGVPTIGYGHTRHIDKLPKTITADEAHTLLLNDLIPVEYSIDADVFAAISQHQYDALCSFVFNVGVAAFHTSTLRKSLNDGNYLHAAGNFDKWVYDNGKIIPGLVKRRALEKVLFLTPMDEEFKL